ncbi:MAG: putative metalloprotease CJM1_0395 family protein [Magnetospiraceae bacterium]
MVLAGAIKPDTPIILFDGSLARVKDVVEAVRALEPQSSEPQNPQTPNQPPPTSRPSSALVDGTGLVSAQEQSESQGSGGTAARGTGNSSELSDEELAQVQALRRVDSEVRAHERAHQAAGGSLTGGASYTYTRGPDGRLYATSGEVSIDISPGRTPSETIARMDQVIRAALAPANPSSQDLKVAAAARQLRAEALAELQAERFESQQGQGPAETDATATQEPDVIQEKADTAVGGETEDNADTSSRDGAAPSFVAQAVDAYQQAQNLARRAIDGDLFDNRRPVSIFS